MVEMRNKARFATEGFRVKRLNPDKTYAGPQRTLGFAGVIDLTDVLTDGKAELAVKIDAQEWQEEEVDFSGYEPDAITPEEAAQALTGAGFAGVVFSVDSDTGRLKAAAAGSKELQIKGRIAGALDFGSCREYGGLGLYYLSFFNDETIGITAPVDMKESENIDLEGAKGTVTRLVIPGKRLGVSPVITTRFMNHELVQMIQGGKYIPGTVADPAVYLPPTSQSRGSPLFCLDVFAPLYGDGTSGMEQYMGFERILYWSCAGTEGEVPMNAKAWAQFAYNVKATEYTDENGKLWPTEKREELSIEQFEAMRIYDI